MPKKQNDKKRIPVLTVLRGPYKGNRMKILGRQFSIGRDDNNDMQIKDIHVSSVHCFIRLTVDDSIELIDKSANGTLVNRKEVHRERIILKNNATIGIGPTLLVFQFEEPD